ncbi:hypothetical protein Tco_0417322, partial [Tanacetum coccineum]
SSILSSPPIITRASIRQGEIALAAWKKKIANEKENKENRRKRKENPRKRKENPAPPPKVPRLKSVLVSRGDGNCGFRSVAVALGLSEDQWPRIRSDLVQELEANHQNYKYIFGTTGYKKIYKTVPFAGKWMEMPNMRLIIASAYNRVVISLANGGNAGGCTTTFPLWSCLPQSEPHETIVIAHVYGNHYIKAALREGCPLPMTDFITPFGRLDRRGDIASRREKNHLCLVRPEEFRRSKLLSYF